MIINFAGSDKSGKTEISKELSSRLGIPYYKNYNERLNFVDNPSYFRETLKFGSFFLADVLHQAGTSLIFDRNYASEWVYSRAFERETYPELLKDLDTFYAEKLNAKTIICTRESYSNIIDEDFPDTLRAEKLDEINSLYHEFSKWTKTDCYILPVDDHDLEREISDIMKFLDGCK